MYRNKKGKKRNGSVDDNRILITVTVLGSPGPIRLLVNAKESVEDVIRSVLKIYVRQGRLPVLAHDDVHDFNLYRARVVGEALTCLEAVGCSGCRDFLMCKKPMEGSRDIDDDDDDEKDVTRRKGVVSWKSWLNRSLNFTISSYTESRKMISV